MCKDNKSLQQRQYFTIVYYNLLEQLDYQLREYIVFDTLLRNSKRNEFTDGKQFLYNRLFISRNTLDASLNRLKILNFITSIENKRILLNYEISEVFTEIQTSNYSIIYHKHRKDLMLSQKEYCLLYCYYFLSKKYGQSFANAQKYCNDLGIKQREYFRIKRKLLNANLIICFAKNNVATIETITEWFNSVQAKQD
jgi:hypothetical protein